MTSVNTQEIEHFSKDSSHWWDENGPFKPLHRLNPTRIRYIKQQICGHFDRDFALIDSLQGLSILDVGCGGGLVCEPLSRLGGTVTGIDADTQAIDVATDHAKQSELDITYINTDSHSLIDQGTQFDVVLALEIIEHVNSPKEFIQSLKKLVKPTGIIIISTLNRTAKSYALGIVAAEYILGWVPKGTHHWNKFVKPSEISKLCRENNLTPTDICGLIYNPLSGEFSLNTHDLDVNYLITIKNA